MLKYRSPSNQDLLIFLSLCDRDYLLRFCKILLDFWRHVNILFTDDVVVLAKSEQNSRRDAELHNLKLVYGFYCHSTQLLLFSELVLVSSIDIYYLPLNLFVSPFFFSGWLLLFQDFEIRYWNFILIDWYLFCVFVHADDLFQGEWYFCDCYGVCQGCFAGSRRPVAWLNLYWINVKSVGINKIKELSLKSTSFAFF